MALVTEFRMSGAACHGCNLRRACSTHGAGDRVSDGRSCVPRAPSEASVLLHMAFATELWMGGAAYHGRHPRRACSMRLDRSAGAAILHTISALVMAKQLRMSGVALAEFGVKSI
eukprot:362289-Chlamydomonas_euryale.AAC.10